MCFPKGVQVTGPSSQVVCVQQRDPPLAERREVQRPDLSRPSSGSSNRGQRGHVPQGTAGPQLSRLWATRAGRRPQRPEQPAVPSAALPARAAAARTAPGAPQAVPGAHTPLRASGASPGLTQRRGPQREAGDPCGPVRGARRCGGGGAGRPPPLAFRPPASASDGSGPEGTRDEGVRGHRAQNQARWAAPGAHVVCVRAEGRPTAPHRGGRGPVSVG